MKKVTLGGIVKHTGGGVGFKSTFTTEEEAQRCKAVLRYLLLNSGYKVGTIEGYYDQKEDKKGGK